MKEITDPTSRFIKRRTEQGAALVTSIFALLLVTLLGIALTSIGVTALTVSTNDRENTEAFYIAEAGIVHALRLVSTAGRSQFTNILRAGDGTAGNGDELSTDPIPADQIRIPQAGIAFAAAGAGRYTVRISDDPADGDGNSNADSNGRLRITATGTGRNGATATIEATVGMTVTPAFLVNGNLRINGNPIIRGPGGAVHSNFTLDLDGNPCVDQYLSASGSVIDPNKARSGAGCGNPGVTRASEPNIPITPYDIRTAFRSRADYILGIDGNVYNSSGTMIDSATGDGKWEMAGGGIWDWDSGGKRWTLGGDTLPDGTYYSEGNMTVSGNPGTSSSPVRATLIAEGYIDVPGAPYLLPDLENYSMMAGTDLKIGGSPTSGSASLEGLHYAGHQVNISGNPPIHGQVLAANLADTASPGGVNFIQLSSGYMEVSGNPTITYSGGLTSGAATLVGWREVRN